jgi:hypothetical protein
MITVVDEKPKTKSKKKKEPSIKSLEEYLLTCPNKSEKFSFETQDETSAFGDKLRKIAMDEEGAPNPWDLAKFNICTSYLTVRISLK